MLLNFVTFMLPLVAIRLELRRECIPEGNAGALRLAKFKLFRRVLDYHVELHFTVWNLKSDQLVTLNEGSVHIQA